MLVIREDKDQVAQIIGKVEEAFTQSMFYFLLVLPKD